MFIAGGSSPSWNSGVQPRAEKAPRGQVRPFKQCGYFCMRRTRHNCVGLELSKKNWQKATEIISIQPSIHPLLMNCTALCGIFILLFSLAATKFRALNHRSACVFVYPLHSMHAHMRPKVRRPPAFISRLAAEGSCHPTVWKEMVLRRKSHDRRDPLGRRLKGSRGTKVLVRPSTALGEEKREGRKEEKKRPEG